MHHYRIAVIPGDGIGMEVTPAACAVLTATRRRHGLAFEFDKFDGSCQRYGAVGAMKPEDTLDQIRHHDAILLGAVGWPGAPDDVSLWGSLIPIRRAFQQYVNQRPITVFEGVPSPWRSVRPGDQDGEVDFVVVRENCEGEYSTVGGHFGAGTDTEFVVQDFIFTRTGVTRIADYAFTLAGQRNARLVSATKSNGIIHTTPSCERVVNKRAQSHPSVTWRHEHIDALAAKLVLQPASFDVILASNLFGDILSDVGAAVSGSIGMAPSANLNLDRNLPVDVRAGPWVSTNHRWPQHRQPRGRRVVGGTDARPSWSRGRRRRGPHGGAQRPADRRTPDRRPWWHCQHGRGHHPQSSGSSESPRLR
jgi:tartrate dehydrogenase/decarboxylase/D-malate dehydrogenase